MDSSQTPTSHSQSLMVVKLRPKGTTTTFTASEGHIGEDRVSGERLIQVELLLLVHVLQTRLVSLLRERLS